MAVSLLSSTHWVDVYTLGICVHTGYMCTLAIQLAHCEGIYDMYSNIYINMYADMYTVRGRPRSDKQDTQQQIYVNIIPSWSLSMFVINAERILYICVCMYPCIDIL